MDSQITPPLQPNVALRQTEESPTNRSPPAPKWFYIVDIEATGVEEPHALQNGGAVLAISATEADADTATALKGIGVVYYAELSETKRRSLTARIDDPQRSKV